MILSNEDAIRAGYANLASYQHAQRMQAVREAEQADASAQAELMAKRRAAQHAGGGGSSACYVPAQPRLGTE